MAAGGETEERLRDSVERICLSPNTITGELTCSICFEIFDSPRTLPACLHTFCEECLFKVFDQSRYDLDPIYQCPVCRKDVKPPRYGTNLKNWVKEFPVNHVINTLLASFKKKQEEKLVTPKGISSEQCSSCEALETTEFCFDCHEFMCQKCVDLHNHFKVTKGHATVSVSGMENLEKQVIELSKSTICQIHCDKKLEFYCKADKSPLCSVCATVVHRKCRDVISLDNLIIENHPSQKVKDSLRNLNDIKSKLKSHQNVLLKNKELIKEDLRKVIASVSGVTNKAIIKLHELENKTVENCNCLEKKITDSINENLQSCKILEPGVEELIAKLDVAMKFGSDLQLFLTMDKMKRETESVLQTVANEHTLVDNFRMTFSESRVLSKLMVASTVGHAAMTTQKIEIKPSDLQIKDKTKELVNGQDAGVSSLMSTNPKSGNNAIKQDSDGSSVNLRSPKVPQNSATKELSVGSSVILRSPKVSQNSATKELSVGSSVILSSPKVSQNSATKELSVGSSVNLSSPKVSQNSTTKEPSVESKGLKTNSVSPGILFSANSSSSLAAAHERSQHSLFGLSVKSSTSGIGLPLKTSAVNSSGDFAMSSVTVSSAPTTASNSTLFSKACYVNTSTNKISLTTDCTLPSSQASAATSSTLTNITLGKFSFNSPVMGSLSPCGTNVFSVISTKSGSNLKDSASETATRTSLSVPPNSSVPATLFDLSPAVSSGIPDFGTFKFSVASTKSGEEPGFTKSLNVTADSKNNKANVSAAIPTSVSATPFIFSVNGLGGLASAAKTTCSTVAPTVAGFSFKTPDNLSAFNYTSNSAADVSSTSSLSIPTSTFCVSSGLATFSTNTFSVSSTNVSKAGIACSSTDRANITAPSNGTAAPLSIPIFSSAPTSGFMTVGMDTFSAAKSAFTIGTVSKSTNNPTVLTKSLSSYKKKAYQKSVSTSTRQSNTMGFDFSQSVPAHVPLTSEQGKTHTEG